MLQMNNKYYTEKHFCNYVACISTCNKEECKMEKANENTSKSSHRVKEDEIATEAGVILKLQSLQTASEGSGLAPTNQLPSNVLEPLEDNHK